jgi:uncharacterized protein YbjT (DUF2867 family)
MDGSEKIVVVFGATGKQGGATAHHLLADGFAVRAFTRNPTSPATRSLRELGAQIVQGDLDDVTSIDAAMTGAYGVFSVQSWRPDGPEAEQRRGIAVAEAAARAGIAHFTYSSVGGADRDSGIPHFESKWNVEQRISELKLPATIWRPVYFMENLLGQREAMLSGYVTPALDPDVPLQMIAVDDIGAFVSLGFSQPEQWLGRATEIAGDSCTFNSVARVLEGVLGHKIEVGRKSDDPQRRKTAEWFEHGGYQADIDRLRQVLPELHNFESWARQALTFAAMTT